MAEQDLITIEKYDSALLKQLIENANEYADNFFSENTKESYERGWNTFLQWTKEVGIDPISTLEKEALIVLFIVHRTKLGYKITGTKTFMFGILSHYRELGFHIDMNKPKVKKVLTGIRKSVYRRPTQKTPILIEDLKGMINSIQLVDKYGFYNMCGYRNRALLLLGFTGAFRESELVAIKYEDLTFSRDGILVLLRKSKEDQEGQGMEKIIPYGSNGLTCPIRAMNDWLELSEIKSGVLFPKISYNNIMFNQPLDPYTVALIIKQNKYIKDKGAEQYSGHSLRAGFVTQAVKNKVPPDLIMKQTGHRSYDVMMGYARRSVNYQETAAAMVGL
jgi:integrase